jgi:hypothetical protein
VFETYFGVGAVTGVLWFVFGVLLLMLPVFCLVPLMFCEGFVLGWFFCFGVGFWFVCVFFRIVASAGGAASFF